MSRGALVVIGSGPGIGLSVASIFAAKGFSRIFLISRNASRLEDDKAGIIAASGKNDIRVDTVAADISDQQSLAKALQRIDEEKYVIECVFFNAARVEPSELLKFPVEEIELDFKACTMIREFVEALRLTTHKTDNEHSLVSNCTMGYSAAEVCFRYCRKAIALRDK